MRIKVWDGTQWREAGWQFTVPEAPRQVTAVAGDASAMISWMAPISGPTVLDYEVTTSPPTVTRVVAGLVVTLVGLINGQSYVASVRARGSLGHGPAATSSAFTPTTSPPGGGASDASSSFGLRSAPGAAGLTALNDFERWLGQSDPATEAVSGATPRRINYVLAFASGTPEQTVTNAADVLARYKPATPPAGEQVILDATFENRTAGNPYSVSEFRSDVGPTATIPSGSDWAVFNGYTGTEANIVSDPFGGGQGKVLEAVIPQGELGAAFAYITFPDQDEAWLEYTVAFGTGFDFTEGGGKLPGLFGWRPGDLDGPPMHGQGGGPNTGFSSRHMWTHGPNGEYGQDAIIQTYNYHESLPPESYGDGDVIWDAAPLIAGRWYKVRQRVRVNDPGDTNGEVEVWVTDLQTSVIDTFKRTGLQLRSDTAHGVNGFKFDTYFGGGQEDAHGREERLYYGYFKSWVASASGWPYHVILSVPLCWGTATGKANAITPNAQGDSVRLQLQRVAQGTWDATWDAIGDAFATHMPYASCRLGWEYDFAWPEWSIADNTAPGTTPNASYYRAAYQHAARRMRARCPTMQFTLCGSHARFQGYALSVFQPGVTGFGTDGDGRPIVNTIGCDLYNQGVLGHINDTMSAAQFSAAWAADVLPTLNLVRDTAIQHGCQVSFDEFGLRDKLSRDATGGGDNWRFIEAMMAWIDALPDMGPGSIHSWSYFNYQPPWTIWPRAVWPTDTADANYVAQWAGQTRWNFPNARDSLHARCWSGA